MRMKQTMELAKVNMIYANPQNMEAKRNKEAKTGQTSKTPAYMSLVWQNALMLVIFLVMFGFIFSNINLAEYPGMFTTFAALFILMALLQGFYMFYNLFYESRDLVHYMPLPFKESEIFAAKLGVLAFMLLPYLFPVWILFLFLGLDAGNTLLLLVPGSLLLFLLVMAVVFAFSTVLVHLITKLPLFHKNKQMITTILYALSTFGMVAVFFFISMTEPSEVDLSSGILPDMRVIPFFSALHRIFVEPASIGAWVGILGWVALLAVLLLIVSKWVIPTFYQEDTGRVSVKPTKHPRNRSTEATTPKTINQTLFKYNLGLIQDGTLIMQFLTSKLLLPLVVIGPNLFNGLDLNVLPLLYWPAFFFGGFILTFLTLNAVSIVGVIISLDRENFLYIKSLPFSMKNYLQQKFWFAFAVEWIIPALLIVAVMIFARLPILLGLSLLTGLTVGTLALSQFYFVRDYRFLSLDWQNLTELFNRGGGNWLQVVNIFVSVFLGMLAVVLVTLALTFLPPLWRTVVSVAVILIPLAVLSGLFFKYKRTFWAQFED